MARLHSIGGTRRGRLAAPLTSGWALPRTAPYKDNVGLNPPRLGFFNVMTFSWASGAVNQYLNDRANGTGTYTPGVPADGGRPLRIGSRDDLVTQLKGNVAEVLIYQPALSDADRGSVVNYLKNKWNLNFILPPTISIQTPASGLNVAAGGSVPVTVAASDSNANGVLTSLTLLNNGSPGGQLDPAPLQCQSVDGRPWQRRLDGRGG